MNNEKKPAMIIYSDGSIEHLEPMSIIFFEQLAQMFASQANKGKQETMINPPPVMGNDGT